MLEKDLNTIWNNMFKQHGFSYKIPDPQKNMMGGISDSKRPFDVFSCVFGRNWYVENKLIKDGYFAFNFNRIEDHQWTNLEKISQDNPKNMTLFGIGFWKKRQFFDILVLDFSLIQYLKEQGVKSIKKKQIEKLKENGLLIPIKKKTFDAESVIEKIVTIEVWQTLMEGE